MNIGADDANTIVKFMSNLIREIFRLQADNDALRVKLATAQGIAETFQSIAENQETELADDRAKVANANSRSS